jgi:hypothetical protein
MRVKIHTSADLPAVRKVRAELMQAEEKTGGKKNGNYLYETIT